MNSLQEYENGQFNVRTITDDNGEIWFVAKDIAIALEYTRFDSNLVQNVPEIWKGTKRIRTPGGDQEMLCLTEQRVYFFLGRSDKPKALPYQMWIAGDVVTSIKKHGAYLTPQAQEELIANPDFIIRLAQELKAERIKVKALQEQSAKDRPKVIFADAVDASDNSILIGNLAKILRQNGVEIGQNRLFTYLRENGYLIRCKGERWNMPTQESMLSFFTETSCLSSGIRVMLSRTGLNSKETEKIYRVCTLPRSPSISSKDSLRFSPMKAMLSSPRVLGLAQRFEISGEFYKKALQLML